MSTTATRPSRTTAREVPAAERRLARRHRVLQRCLVRPQGAVGAQDWRCIAYNISTTGIGITLPYPAVPGTVVEIEAWGLPAALPLRARVLHSKPVGFLWFCGCELVSRLREHEVQDWRAGPTDWFSQY